MKVLVTGGTGFLGIHLVSQLVTRGHLVRTFSRSARLPSNLAGLPLEHFCGDVTNAEQVEQAIAGCDAVFHLAGLVSYRQSDCQQQFEINVIGTRTIMEQCLKAGIGRVIYTGSIAGMGIPAPGTIGTEEIKYNLAGRQLNYCDSKHAAEQEVMKYIKLGVPAIILNPGIIFGEGDSHPHHLAIFTALSKGWLFGCPPGGVSFCDIRDVVNAHINAIAGGQLGHRYALASANLTFIEAANAVCQILNCPTPRFIIPGWLLKIAGSFCEEIMPRLGKSPSFTKQVAWLSQQKIFFSAEKAMSELAYTQTKFEETIKRTASYYMSMSNDKRTLHHKK